MRLCLWARPEIRGDNLSDILRDLGIPCTTFLAPAPPRSRCASLPTSMHCGQAGDEQGACFQVQLPAAPRSNNASQAS